jgi:hypothetical protein
MGAWGFGALENDDACDYADEIVAEQNLSGVERTLDKTLGVSTGYLEAPDGAETLAAAEILARLLGRPGAGSPRLEALDDWIARAKLSPAHELVDKARRAVERVMTEPSELMELWFDSNDFDSWKSSVEDLSRRLDKTA